MPDDSFPWFLGFPFSSSLLYVLGALFLKRSAQMGVGVWRTTFVSNLTAAALFLPLLALGGQIPSLLLLWQPFLVALLFIAGQALAFYSLNRGDVSIATPVLGLKIILVAAFTTVILGHTVSAALWTAAILSTLGIVLLQHGGASRHHSATPTILSAGLAAAAFAAFDVLVQKWSPAWGAGRFLPVMLAMVALLSLGFLPLFRGPLRQIPDAAKKWLWAGCACIALQSVLLVYALAVHGQATAINVVYSLRGLWSVVAVWGIGHWFANAEQHLGRNILLRRLAGAALMTAALLLVLV